MTDPPSIAALRAERDDRASDLASATDLANTYAREHSVEEAENERGLKGVIQRLAWKLASTRAERDAARAEVERLRADLAEARERAGRMEALMNRMGR